MNFSQSIFSTINRQKETFTELENSIADYFLEAGKLEKDLSSQAVAQRLHISQAALTRFAKKCDFSGYRAFLFQYQKELADVSKASLPQIEKELTRRVFYDYEELIQQTQKLIDEDQIQRIATMIEEAERVYFFGLGSSGLVAREFKLRLMRLGVVCEALTDRDSFSWTISILDEKCLAIGFSLSGETKAIIDSLLSAQEMKAKTILLTTAPPIETQNLTENVKLASVYHLNYGNRISPQFPMLILLDILYAHFREIDRPRKEEIFNSYWTKPYKRIKK
ncbi:MurR/RpiR family transcriptional regulator [Streptococcus gallinaceus]|uniref:DNA-binding MurR/RpiR family transcriptional regulator n=1 Tax=Streptococcus gallinaceus TaxID=165758 RepID=A0ABV2JIP8_9STRE|nr:MurR/RpiR family transcriptional regulator [Streptococcus gallinaceus]MCP1638705.1 DNA-binding MurR/RpiR family transcriptional regulator [Streptococcus gallinaceus]MCP1769208.1 DNA-binding MurR/RpiR family transcriptional regulator [Streptococcus gallinaceus]